MFDNIDKFLYTIKNYLINNEIIINDDYDADVKLKLYLLKYRKLIGLTLLLLLLLLGYYCNPYENLFNNDNDNNNNSKNELQIQKGGAGGLPGALALAGTAVTKTATTLTTPGDTGGTGAPKLSSFKKFRVDQKAVAKDTALKPLKAIGGVGKKIASGAKEAVLHPRKTTAKVFNKGYDFGAAAAHKFTENTDLIYQILYSIALFIVICIVAVPSIAFLIIGIVCYFLLKDKMKTIKGL